MVALASSLFVATTTAATTATAPRVVVFFVADDLGWNDLGSGTSAVATPTIDALRRSGVSLTNYYTSCVCSPSRGSFLSGRLPLHLGYDNVIASSAAMGIPLDAPLLPAMWAAANANRGSRRAESHALGKWHVGMYQDALLPTRRGFDTFFGYLCGSTSYTTHGNDEPCPYVMANGTNATHQVFALDLSTGTKAPPVWSAATDPALRGVYDTEMYTAALERILDGYVARNAAAAAATVKDAATPASLLLYIAPNNVHTPLAAPQRFIDPYVGKVAQKSRLTFSGDVSALDEFVLNVTQALKDRGLWANATFVFTSDNGGNLHGGGNNWPLRSGKFSLWEGGIRANAFVTGAGITRSNVNATGLMSSADWYRTIERLIVGGGGAGRGHAAGPGGANSVDQLAMINGAVASARDELAISIASKATGKSALRGGGAGATGGEMKLLVNFPGQSTKTGCAGGCWCPLPDPRSGVQTCVPPLPPPNASLSKNPPSAECAAAMLATGCGAQTSSRACATCAKAQQFNASLSAAGCRWWEKDLKHWCNNHCAGCPPPSPPTPTPPGPSPPGPSPPSPTRLPCELPHPCLFNISADPLEQHDLGRDPAYSAVVQTMLARVGTLRNDLTASLFPGGHYEGLACASLNRTGAWAPWVKNE